MSIVNPGRSLTSILMRIGGELEAAGASVDKLHTLVEVLVREGIETERFYQEAQRIDILQQHLMELASFIRNIAAETPEGWTICGKDAVSSVKLSNLRDRLAHCNVLLASEDDSNGDIHLF